MLSETDRYILNRCKRDPEFAKGISEYDQTLDAAVAVYELRQHLHLSQREFAAKIGIPHATISRIENGDMSPSSKLLGKIALKTHKQLRIQFV